MKARVLAFKALRREIEREEAEEKAKLPSLSEIGDTMRAYATTCNPGNETHRRFLAAAEIVKLLRDIPYPHRLADNTTRIELSVANLAQHARLE